MVKRRSSKSKRASKGVKRKHTRKVKSPVVKRRKSRTSKKTRNTRKSSKKRKSSKRGGAIRMPSEYFGRNSGKYGEKTKHGVSFPHTNLNYTHV
jgi:hypothetical protein